MDIVIENDVQRRVKSSFKQTTKFDHKKPAHENNQKAGVNIKSFGGAN